jgi:thiol-disulfide isomerase/thioredoxin
VKPLPLFLALCLLSACGDGPGTVNLASARGHWVVINYWAEWCKPCIKEIPEINQLAREQAGLRVFGVNYDGASGDELQEQVERLGIEFPLLIADPAAELGIQRPGVLPTTLIIRPDGSLAATLVGPQTKESLLEATEIAKGTQ